MRTQTYHVIQLLTAERDRQVEAEGYSQRHDDQHDHGELALAAAIYAIPADFPEIQGAIHELLVALESGVEWILKPEPDRKRALVKAGALIIAELERLERAGA